MVSVQSRKHEAHLKPSTIYLRRIIFIYTTRIYVVSSCFFYNSSLNTWFSAMFLVRGGSRTKGIKQRPGRYGRWAPRAVLRHCRWARGRSAPGSASWRRWRDRPVQPRAELYQWNMTSRIWWDIEKIPTLISKTSSKTSSLHFTSKLIWDDLSTHNVPMMSQLLAQQMNQVLRSPKGCKLRHRGITGKIMAQWPAWQKRTPAQHGTHSFELRVSPQQAYWITELASSVAYTIAVLEHRT